MNDDNTTTAVIVRAATEEDMQEITSIYAAHVETSFATSEATPPKVSETRDRWQQTLETHLPYLVAERNGHVVGFSYARPFRQRSGYGCTVENSVYVQQGLEGQGVGGMLLTDLLRRSETIGKKVMIAVTGVKSGEDWAESPSYRLHRRYGFAMCGLLPGAVIKNGHSVDVLILQKQLGSNVSP